MAIEYKRATLDEDTVAQLIDLSYVWEKENNVWGLRHNDRSDLMEPCIVAKDGPKIVGYVFGEYNKNEKLSSFAKIGDTFFYVEELYVLPEYRSQGIGRELFRLLEEEVRDQAQFITLSTATKDYPRILKFYAEELDMTFFSAYLFKKTK